jgi:hypothetical protein
MALLSIWSTNPDAVLSFSIEQIVSTAGNGKLLDNNECSKELRTFLSQVSSEKLAEYADYCLNISFNNGGKVLQDIINELGRRLDYKVTNGLYQGKSNAVGNDGLWLSPENHYLLIEVKTSDAFRISLETIAEYRNKLQDEQQISESSSMLLIVGREDTGGLEAQIRGSRFAWDMRLISIDSLIRLVNLKENTEDEITSSKIRSVLVPMEFTRLDALIDLMFTTAKDVEKVIDIEKQQEPKEEVEESTKDKSNWNFTESALIERKREDILKSFAVQNNERLVRRSKAMHWNANRDFRTVCTVSKRYENKSNPYWYAYHPKWQEFLNKGSKGYFILGCMDLDFAFAIPVQIVESRLSEFNITPNNGNPYWHIKILQPEIGKYLLQMPKTGKHLDLTPFIIHLS